MYKAEEGEEDSVIADPQYKYFLENVMLDGESYVLDIIENNVFVKYEDESSTPDALTDCEIENANHVSNPCIVDTEMHTPANYEGKRRGRKPKGPKLHADRSCNGSGSHVASEAQKHAGNHRVKRARKNVVPSPVETACFSQTEGQNFDHGTKVNHIDTLPSLATRVQEEIEDYDDDAPPIRRLVQDPILNVEHFWDDDEANARKFTKYKKKLMEELKMLCCQEEYERLLEDIIVRKPVQREKVLRGRTKIYEEDYDGKSLFDHHIEMHTLANYEGKRRGRKPKGPKLHDDKSGYGSGSHVAPEAQKYAGKRRGRKPEGQNLSADKNPNCSTSSNHVASEPQKHVHNYKGKRRGRKPKGQKLYADKNPNGSCSSNHVASEPQKHVHNYKGKRRGRKPKGQKLYADKNPNGSSSSNHVASEPQKHVNNHKGKRRGRKPKRGSKLHATKNPNGSSNHVASEAHKHAGKHRVKRAKKNVVPSAVETACLNHIDTSPCIATRVKEEIEDYNDDAPRKRRRMPVHDPALNVEHFWDDDEANARKLTKYREKLMEELKMPYCQEEYERLLKDITVRKPVQREKVLRGRTKIYEEDYDGKSLLDHNIDLKKKIDSARDDHPKVLNLLRGFFYWLKNLSHEGAFKPWRDPSCLDVLSQL